MLTAFKKLRNLNEKTWIMEGRRSIFLAIVKYLKHNMCKEEVHTQAQNLKKQQQKNLKINFR